MNRTLFSIAIGVLLLSPSNLRGAVWRVSPSGNPLASGSSWQFPTTLQHALDRVQSGDEIWLMEGTYFPADAPDAGAAFHLRSGIALYGGFAGSEESRAERDPAAFPTILSGDFEQDDLCPEEDGPATATIVGTNATVVAHAIDSFDVVLDGLAVTGAAGSAINAAHATMELRDVTITCNVGTRSGAGFFGTDCSLVFEKVTFSRNRGTDVNADGGALALDHCGQVTISSCVFNYNRSLGEGGGIHALNTMELLVANTTFMANNSPVGGGMTVRGGEMRVVGCRFFINETGESGGGLLAVDCDSLQVEHTDFIGNEGDRGGGCHIDNCMQAWFNWVRFVANDAGEDGGGGLLVTGIAPTLRNVEFTHNAGDEDSGGLMVERATGTTTIIGGVFTGNIRGAIYSRFSGPLALMNVTVANNMGSGAGGTVVIEGGDVDLLNTIIWEPVFGEVDVSGGNLSQSHSNIGDFDPLFVDPVDANAGPDFRWDTADDILPDLRLQQGSGSIDTGIAYALMPDLDMQGLSRMLGAAIDQGAFEFTEDPATFDRDHDGVPDVEELIAGTDTFNAASFFALRFASTAQPEARAEISWRTVAGRTYVIECSPDLDIWTPVFESVALESDELMTYSKSFGTSVYLRGRVSVRGVGIGAR